MASDSKDSSDQTPEELRRDAETGRRFFHQAPDAAIWLDDYVLGRVDAIDEHDLAEELGVSVTGLRRGADLALAEGA